MEISFPYVPPLLTSCLGLVDNGQMAVALAVLLYAGRYLERAYSSKEYAKFLAVCTIVPNLMAFAACILVYHLFGWSSFLYSPVSCPG